MDSIQQLIEDEFAAGNAGDTEALLSLRTHGAVEMFPGEPTLVGKDAIRSEWGQGTDVIEQFTDRSVDDIQLVGDWALVRFSFTHTVAPANGGTANASRCRGLWVIRRQPDDSWKIHWEMVNSE